MQCGRNQLWRPRTFRSRLKEATEPEATGASVDAAVLGANTGNATVSPDPVRLANGAAGELALTWRNLAPGSYIGRITFAGASAPTFVTVVVPPGGALGAPPPSEDPKKKNKQGKVQNEDLIRPPDNSVEEGPGPGFTWNPITVAGGASLPATVV